MKKNLVTLLMLSLFLILSQNPAHAGGLKRGVLGVIRMAVIRPIFWTSLGIHILSGMADSKIDEAIVQDRIRENLAEAREQDAAVGEKP
jgi:hypothetical protein